MSRPRGSRKIGTWSRRPNMNDWHCGAMWCWDLDDDNRFHIYLEHNVFQLRGFINGFHVAAARAKLSDILEQANCYLSIVEVEDHATV